MITKETVEALLEASAPQPLVDTLGCPIDLIHALCQSWLEQQEEMSSLRSEIASLRSAQAETREALEVVCKAAYTAREGLALMAEGEGPDADVYMEMSLHHMKLLDKTLTSPVVLAARGKK